MRSIRHHLLRHLLVGIVPLLVVGCAALFLVLRFYVIREFDAGLRAQAGALASMAERVGDGVDFDYDVEEIPDYLHNPRPGYFELWLSDGSVLQRSASLKGQDLERFEGGFGEFRITTVTLPDGREGRACATLFEPRHVDPKEHEGGVTRPNAPPGPVLLIAERGIDDYVRPLGALATGLAGMAGLLIGGFVVIIRRSVQYGLSPLDAMGTKMGAIGPAGLHQRIAAEALPRELKPIGARLNELLARLEAAFERERRFTDSAAHELRTPVAEIRALAEVAMRFPSDPTLAGRTLAEVLTAATEMERTIEVLLGIARANSAAARINVSPVDVGRLVESQWARRAERATSRALRVSMRISENACVESDAAMLALIVSNLLENAVEYTTPGGSVDVHISGDADGVLLQIDNDAADLSASDVEHVFDPFWRKSRARADAAHSGLGLALVRELCQAAGARVSASLEGGRFGVRVRLPARPEIGSDHFAAEPERAPAADLSAAAPVSVPPPLATR